MLGRVGVGGILGSESAADATRRPRCHARQTEARVALRSLGGALAAPGTRPLVGMADTEPPASGAAAEEEDDNGLAPEEEAQVEFKPIVELKEVEKNTGEDEEEPMPIGDVTKLRAKLFRWESDTWEKEKKMWKERGTGDVKFLASVGDRSVA